jgi:streptogramin lyase
LWSGTWSTVALATLILLPLMHSWTKSRRLHTRSALALLSLIVLAVLMVVPARAPLVYEYAMPGTPTPWGITVDKNSAFWFTEASGNKIAQVSGYGVLEYAVPTPGAVPWAITAGKNPDEDIWFTEETAGKIACYVPSQRSFYEYTIPVPSPSPRPRGITMNITRLSSPPGVTPTLDVWFTDWGRNEIGHLHPTDARNPNQANMNFTLYTIPGLTDTHPLGIAMSPVDYSIWFTEFTGNRISCIKLLENGTAVFRHYPVGLPTTDINNGNLWGIAVDPAGYVWVTESNPTRNCIGRLNPVSGEYLTYGIPTINAQPHEIVLEVGVTGYGNANQLLNIWFTEFNADKIGRYDPFYYMAFYEYPIISAGGKPNGLALVTGPSGALGYVVFTEPFSQKIGAVYAYGNYIITTTTVGTITSAATTVSTLPISRITGTTTWSTTTAVSSSITSTTITAVPVSFTIASQTFTSSMLQLTSTSVYSYSVTSYSTTTSVSSTTTTGTAIILTVSTSSTTTTTTATSTSWNVQTISTTTSATNTLSFTSTSVTSTTVTRTSTSNYPTVTITATNASYVATTTFSPTVTSTAITTSTTATTSTTTSTLTTTSTAWTTVAVARPCIIASVAYGSDLAPEVQFLREFRDGKAIPTFVGSQFMNAFNAFYYSFSPTVAKVVAGDPILKETTRAAINPLIMILRFVTSLCNILPLNHELSILLAGILSSGAIGAIYISPFLVLRKALNRRMRKSGEV